MPRLDAVPDMVSDRLADGAQFVPVGGVSRGEVCLVVGPGVGGVGAESAQGEGAGSEAAVHRIDQFPNGGGLLEHPGQHGHGPFGGEVGAEDAGAHVLRPVQELGDQGGPGRGHQGSGLVGGHGQAHVRGDMVRGSGPVRGGGGGDGDPPGDLAFCAESAGGALGELGHRGPDDLWIPDRVREGSGDQDLGLGGHLVLHGDGGEAVEFQDGAHLHHGERVADGHRVGDGLDPHRLQALGQPPGDAPNLGDRQGFHEPAPVSVGGLVPVDHPVRGGQLLRAFRRDFCPRLRP